MKKNDRVIPKKNYFCLIIMIVAVVFVTFMIFEINKDYQNRKLETSYLENYISEVKLEDLKNILTEPSSELFILVTKTNDEAVYNLESDLKKVIKRYDLRDNFIYIDYTKSENNLNELNNVFGSELKTIPALLYFKNGELAKSVDSSIDMLNSTDLEQILDEYEVN